jgi:hypothetical protein
MCADELGLGGHESVVVPMENRESVIRDLIDEVEANLRRSIEASFMRSLDMTDSVLHSGVDCGCGPVLSPSRAAVEALYFLPACE